ncbi:tetratricopeptide repeat protein, partial [Streptomyces sp. NPDC004237]|uniref:tetratricopeptide repeat protein n=1 Tax=Streptomyces sp. NPDC004237 TaxID=3154455 RepID=UPI0033A7E283
MLTQMLTGMGGVGKTQLAADYARTAWDDDSAVGGLDVLVWVTASSRQAIVTGYAQAGVELCRGDPNDQEKAALSFLAWLTPKAGTKPCRWLIVLDDVADPADLRGLWPPAGAHGRTLVTTRRRDAALAADSRHTIEIGLFTTAEALAYLTASLAGHGRYDSADELTALANDLGYLPLALSQAAAYIIDTADAVAAYRALLADRTTALAAIAPDVLPDDQALPLAAAWSLSVDRADTLRPAGLARPMLQLTSLLDANGIPETVLTSEPARVHLTVHRTRTGPNPAEEAAPVSLRDTVHALRALHRLSLIDHTPDTPHHAVRVHQLIQRATRDTLTPHHHEQTAHAAADALMATWPENDRNTDLTQTLHANTTALSNCAEDALYRSRAHAVLYWATISLGKMGQVIAARDSFIHVAAMAHHHFGADAPDTLAARQNLAYWRGQAGDPAGAATAFAELLPHMARVLGNDHPSVLGTQGELARQRGEAGDAAGAAAALTELLEHMAGVLGRDHYDTLRVRRNLAHWCGEAGDAAAAAAAFAELMADQVRVQGPDHPDTLMARHNLAYWRGEAGDAAGAATAFTELLTDRRRAVGYDHPHTLATQGELARWRGRAGDAAGAKAAFAELLADGKRVLGDDHPYVLDLRGHLARWRGEAGDAAGAATAFAELLTDRRRVLGDDHPSTLTARQNVAYWRGEAGDAAGAAAAFAELMTAQVRIHGLDHPNTFNARGHLARWRGEAGDAAGAAAAFAELAADAKRALSDNHPITLNALHSLIRWSSRIGDASRTAEAHKLLLIARRRLLGENHPDTLAAWGSYAHWLGVAGDAGGSNCQDVWMSRLGQGEVPSLSRYSAVKLLDSS